MSVGTASNFGPRVESVVTKLNLELPCSTLFQVLSAVGSTIEDIFGTLIVFVVCYGLPLSCGCLEVSGGSCCRSASVASSTSHVANVQLIYHEGVMSYNSTLFGSRDGVVCSSTSSITALYVHTASHCSNHPYFHYHLSLVIDITPNFP